MADVVHDTQEGTIKQAPAVSVHIRCLFLQMEMEMQLNDLTTAPSRAHLCVLLALHEAGAALREPYPPPDATATAAPPVDSPSNRARRLPIAGHSNEPPAPTGPPPCCQKRKSHSEPFSQQRFAPECEHMHAEHASTTTPPPPVRDTDMAAGASDMRRRGNTAQQVRRALLLCCANCCMQRFLHNIPHMQQAGACYAGCWVRGQ